MLTVKKQGVILEKSGAAFESAGVLNPAVIKSDNAIHLFYRAVATGNRSTIGYCRLSDPLTVEERLDFPVIVPEFEYESQGVEDPRIVQIDNLYYLTYTAYDGFNAFGALSLSSDLVHFIKKGIIAPRIGYKDFQRLVTTSGQLNRKYFRFDQSSTLMWDKNLIFFPRRINGQLAFLHRIRPGIQIVYVDELEALTDEFWTDYFKSFQSYIVLDPKYDHETSYLGGGCPPIETQDGWLLIYHAVKDTLNGYIYSACAALLDLEKPEREIARLPYPLFSPEEDYEKSGKVDNVCFPTGALLQDDTLYIYYGAADERIACATIAMPELMDELKKQPQ
ncbi:MAG: pesticidal protein Cry7Aa [Flavobacterium sp.]|nr:MAG: pesticidal protein Cry7Aa [Flavobacterium sp.]